MLELTRSVRFCLNPGPTDLGPSGSSAGAPRDNTFSAWPAMRGLGRYYELHVTCRGVADPKTGYFINIREIDTAVRDQALPYLHEQIKHDALHTPMGALMHTILALLQPELHESVTQIEMALTPYLSLTAEQNDMNSVLLKQQYDFSAAHRLHVADLSDADNRAVFGKCNNPAGHGHNYRLQVVARCTIDEHGRALEAGTLDAAVNRHCIEHLDHKHLNLDVPELAGLNPSVEHIAQVIWKMLVSNMPQTAGLEEISVWETDKTVCTYRGQ